MDEKTKSKQKDGSVMVEPLLREIRLVGTWIRKRFGREATPRFEKKNSMKEKIRK
jgi:hypothetical protein